MQLVVAIFLYLVHAKRSYDLTGFVLAGSNVPSILQLQLSHWRLSWPPGTKAAAVISRRSHTCRNPFASAVSAWQRCACTTIHHDTWGKEHVLRLGVILIANAFPSNLFQSIFCYTPHLGIPLGLIIAWKKTRAGGREGWQWSQCWKTLENICFELPRPKGGSL